MLAADAIDNHDIAGRLEINREQANSWRIRIVAGGVAAIFFGLPERYCKPTIDTSEVVRTTAQGTPESLPRWSTRKRASRLGISDASVLKV